MIRTKHFSLIVILVTSLCSSSAFSQIKLLSLGDVVQLAQENSLEALLAKHRFRSNYWQYRSYKAKYLPSVSMDAQLIDLQRAIVKNSVFESGNWVEKYGESRRMNSSLDLSISQNIPITGGKLFIRSNLGRLDLLNDDPASYRTTPISVGLVQPLFSYNEFKWEKKLEPMRYKQAEKEYLERMESVNMMAVSYFFDLALAEKNLKVFEFNLKNNKELLEISRERFALGTIEKDELMQLEINGFKFENSYNKGLLEVEDKKARLRSMLGYKDNIDFELITSTEIPSFKVDVTRAIALAIENNPGILSMETQLMEAESNLARAKADARFNADLVASYGLTQSSSEFIDSYKNPQAFQQASIGVRVPILDWGMRKGRVKMAESYRDVAQLSVDKQSLDFNHQVYMDVMEFNMQEDQLNLAAKTDSLAQSRFEITQEKYLLGQANLLQLNDAIRAKDDGVIEYLLALRTYWNYYYNIRKTTLFDFEGMKALMEDYEALVN